MVGIRGEVIRGCSDLNNENVFTTAYHQKLVMQLMCSGSHLQF